MPRPRFIINTTLACDANLLTFRRLAEFFGVEQYVIDVPYGQDEGAVRYVTDQLRGMKDFIEKQTGRRIDEERSARRRGPQPAEHGQFQPLMTTKAEKRMLSAVTDQMFTAFTLHNLLGTGRRRSSRSNA